MLLEGHLGVGLASAFAILCWTAGAWHLRRTARLLRSGVRASAVVVAVADPTEAAFPVVRFADTDGVVHRMTLSVGDGSAAVGATVEVVYPRGHPDQACQVSAIGLWLVPAECVVAGVVALWAAARLALAG